MKVVMENTIYKIEIYHDLEICSQLEDVMYKICDDDALINDVIPHIVKTENGKGKNIHHILATLLPIGEIFDKDYDFLKQYMFLGDGTLFVERKYRNFNGKSNFKGRDEEECKFKVGDVVIIDFKDNFDYGVVYSLPPKKGKFSYLDSTDDSYTILVGLKEIPENMDEKTYMKYHEHIELINAFPYKE